MANLYFDFTVIPCVFYIFPTRIDEVKPFLSLLDFHQTKNRLHLPNNPYDSSISELKLVGREEQRITAYPISPTGVVSVLRLDAIDLSMY